MTRPELQGTKRDITVGQLQDELGVDVLGRDADLDEHFFPVYTLGWHGGTVNDDQEIDVIYANTFTKSRSMRKQLVNSLWKPYYEKLVDKYVKHECSDGILYEIQWRPHKQHLSDLLPPNGTCYTLVSAFLLREQELHDAAELDEDSETTSDESDDDDVEPARKRARVESVATSSDSGSATDGVSM